MASSSGPAVSTEVFASACVDGRVAGVWKVVSQVDLSVLQPGLFTSCTVEDGPAHRVGSLRRCSHTNGSTWVFKVVEVMSHPVSVSYDLVQVETAETVDDGNPTPTSTTAAHAPAHAPFTSCTATFTLRNVTAASSPQTFVSWRAVFSSDAHAQDMAAFRGAQVAGFATLRTTLSASRFVDNVASLATETLPASCNHVMMADMYPLNDAIAKFKTLGGHLCLIDPEAPSPFLVAPSDVIYPVCSSGQNRSQVLRELLLQETAGVSAFTGTIVRAHAALSGVDPYVDDAMSATTATADIDRHNSGFTDAFGHGRDPRIGEDEFPFGGFYEPGAPFLRKAKAWFTKNVYSRTPSMPDGCRRVYFAFDKPVHGVLKRLNEAAAASSSSTPLADTYVVAIPLGDIVAHPPEGIERNSADACHHAFNKFKNMVDFSALA